MASSKMKKYEAPEGKVYDYAEPHTAIIIGTNGEKKVIDEHLYAKFLFLGPRDSIENYKLVKNPKEA